MLIITIDPGILNFAIVICECEQNGVYLKFSKIIHRHRINLSYKGTFLNRKLQELVFNRFKGEFEESFKILVEKQLPHGLSVFNDLFDTCPYREKVEFLEPQDVHRWFRIVFKDKDPEVRYAKRKKFTEEFLVRITDITLHEDERNHDISDAFCQFWMWLNKYNDSMVGVPSHKKSKYF